MKRTTIREFRSNIAELLAGDESVLVTKHGKPAAVVYPLGDPNDIPPDLRRELFLALSGETGARLDAQGVTDDEIERDFAESKKRRRGQ